MPSSGARSSLHSANASGLEHWFKVLRHWSRRNGSGRVRNPDVGLFVGAGLAIEVDLYRATATRSSSRPPARERSAHAGLLSSEHDLSNACSRSTEARPMRAFLSPNGDAIGVATRARAGANRNPPRQNHAGKGLKLSAGACRCGDRRGCRLGQFRKIVGQRRQN